MNKPILLITFKNALSQTSYNNIKDATAQQAITDQYTVVILEEMDKAEVRVIHQDKP